MCIEFQRKGVRMKDMMGLVQKVAQIVSLAITILMAVLESIERFQNGSE